MDQGLDRSGVPSVSYRATFRRHRKLFCLPLVLGVLGAAVFVFGVGRSYRSTASLWVDTTAPVPSSVGASTGTPLAEPPSSAEQGILAELLTTRAFSLAVARSSLLGRSGGGVGSVGQGAVAGQSAETPLGDGVISEATAGDQVLQISYTAPSQALAESVLGAVVAQLRDYTGRLTSEHDQAVSSYDREQVRAAQAALSVARGNVSAYQARHPGVTQSDPTYVSLVSAENNAVTQLAQANTTLSQVAGAGGSSGWSVQVIDPPSPATAASAKKSKVVELVFGGALGGLLVSFLAVVALTPARKEAWEDELPVGGPVVSPVPVAGEPVRAVSPVGEAASGQPGAPVGGVFGERRLAVGDRRFLFRAPSASSEE